MLGKFLTKVVGSKNDREVKRLRKRVNAINALESEFEPLSDEALTAKTAEFRERLAQGEKLFSARCWETRPFHSKRWIFRR